MTILSNTAQDTQSTLEVLVIKMGEERFGVRSKRVLRLARLNKSKLVPPDERVSTQLPSLLGLMGATNLPVLDLATLLGLPEGQTTGSEQVMVINQPGGTVGFLVGDAQEIERVPLKDVKLLPPVLEQMCGRPVVWAIWQRSNQEMIPLVEPTVALSKVEWEILSQLNPSLVVNLFRDEE